MTILLPRYKNKTSSPHNNFLLELRTTSNGSEHLFALVNGNSVNGGFSCFGSSSFGDFFTLKMYHEKEISKILLLRDYINNHLDIGISRNVNEGLYDIFTES